MEQCFGKVSPTFLFKVCAAASFTPHYFASRTVLRYSSENSATRWSGTHTHTLNQFMRLYPSGLETERVVVCMFLISGNHQNRKILVKNTCFMLEGLLLQNPEPRRRIHTFTCLLRPRTTLAIDLERSLLTLLAAQALS